MTTKSTDARYSLVTVAIQHDVNREEGPAAWRWEALLGPCGVHVVNVEELTVDQADVHGIAIKPCDKCGDKYWFTVTEDRGDYTAMTWLDRCTCPGALAGVGITALVLEAAVELDCFWQNSDLGIIMVPKKRVDAPAEGEGEAETEFVPNEASRATMTVDGTTA